MRTSLAEIKKDEEYLLGDLNTGERALMDAQRILDPALDKRIKALECTLDLVRIYGRQQLRKELDDVYQRIFHQIKYQGLKTQILSYFFNSK